MGYLYAPQQWVLLHASHNWDTRQGVIRGGGGGGGQCVGACYLGWGTVLFPQKGRDAPPCLALLVQKWKGKEDLCLWLSALPCQPHASMHAVPKLVDSSDSEYYTLPKFMDWDSEECIEFKVPVHACSILHVNACNEVYPYTSLNACMLYILL